MARKPIGNQRLFIVFKISNRFSGHNVRFGHNIYTHFISAKETFISFAPAYNVYSS